MPSTVAVWVRGSVLAARAMPKSMTFTSPGGVIMMFPGLTSRWTIPAAWAKDRAEATCAAISAARSGMRWPSVFRTSASVLPATYSMTM